MRPLTLLCAILLTSLTFAQIAAALTVAELTAIHDTRSEPYRISSFAIDDEWRADIAEDLHRRLPNDIAGEIMRAATGRFDGAIVHLYQQDDTSLTSYIVALEQNGEIVLLSWHSTAFFEIPALVERRIALLDAVAQAYAPDRFASGWAEATFGAAIQGVHDFHDGIRNAPYPGWAYEDRGGIQSLGQSLIPDWVTITITSLECRPRYPHEGWAILFLCP